MKKIREKFAGLNPKQKKIVIWLLVGLVVLVFTMFSYNSRKITRSNLIEGDKAEVIDMNPDLIQKSMLDENRRKLDSLMADVIKLKKNQEKMERGGNSGLPRIPTAGEIASQEKQKEEKAKQVQREKEKKESIRRGNKIPTTPAEIARQRAIILRERQQQAPPIETEVIGDIAVLNNPDADTGGPVNDKRAGNKKKGRTVYLPPSFMEAQLLTGFDAATSGKGKGSPEPLLLRIQTPAVLPNDIKQDLKGCFVIAEAVGRLDKERADVRLVSLSCLSNEGKAVIDTPIKGFVTDSDSKVGLSGHVVSKMGAATARTILAGFFDGLGEMLKTASTTQSTSALGTTTTVNSSQAGKYALGGGLSEGANSLHDFYLSLARQATPVVEVGAGKKITVVVSEGKELEIKEVGENEI